MKHIAVAIIVVGLMLGDFFAEFCDLSAKSQRGWATFDTFGLMFAALWFWHHRDRKAS